MLAFMKIHRCALGLVFAGALLAFLSVRGIQWSFDTRGLAPFTIVQLMVAMPGAWVLGNLADPILWKLPRAVDLALFEVLVAAGFAFNALVLTIFVWHRRATGRWWGWSAFPRFKRKT